MNKPLLYYVGPTGIQSPDMNLFKMIVAHKNFEIQNF
uniref:Uncharacterized protein n=1 Tax=Rhizophora mucronata TaxID=61149 RepID=A0A2P2N684_RHIMU